MKELVLALEVLAELAEGLWIGLPLPDRFVQDCNSCKPFWDHLLPLNRGKCCSDFKFGLSSAPGLQQGLSDNNLEVGSTRRHPESQVVSRRFSVGLQRRRVLTHSA